MPVQEAHHSTTPTTIDDQLPPRPYDGRAGAYVCGLLAAILTTAVGTLAIADGPAALAPITSHLIVGAVQALLLVSFIVLSTKHAQGNLFKQTEQVARRLEALEEEQHHWQVQQRTQVNTLVDEFTARFLAIEGMLQTALDHAHDKGYDRGWLHGQTGQEPETRVESAPRSLRSV